MANEFDHKLWGAADFKRYHNGSMPDAERHALEKASLEDPFLQDALDGYAFAEDPTADIAEITERLWPAKEEKTLVVALKSNNWDMLWKVAAVFIIAGGLGWLIYSNNQNKGAAQDNDQFAAVEKTAPVKNEVVTSTPDTLPVTVDISPNTASSQVRTAQAPSSVQSSATQEPVVEDESISRVDYDRREQAAAPPTSPAREPVPAAKDAKTSMASENNMISGRVVNPSGQPVPYAQVLVENNRVQQSVAADANGNFSVRNSNAANDKVSIQANAVGYETTNASIANNSNNNNIVLKESNQQLSEVVVTGMAAAKRSARQVSASSQQVSKWNIQNSRVSLKHAVPVAGWDHFYNYMHDSTALKNFVADKKGKVIIRFSVDSSGRITDFILKQRLSLRTDSVSQSSLLQAPALRLTKPGKKAEASFIF